MDSNLLELSKLPIEIVKCSYTYEELHSIGNFNLKSVSALLDDVKESLRNDEQLSTEVQMIKVVCYKVQNVLRNDKQLSALSNVKKCLKKILGLPLPELAKKLNDEFKIAFDPSNVLLKSNRLSTSGVLLPSRQNFEFIQVQIQIMATLLVHTLKIIYSAHSYGLKKLYIGHFIPINLIILSTLSRLWLLLRTYLAKCIELFQRISPLTKILKKTDVLSMNVTFPEDLSQWVNLESLREIEEKNLEPNEIQREQEMYKVPVQIY